ncbi:hypothetical protein [Paenibacillus sp. Soil522]|uniref:hypothetical protein n=1 Tax=Paenibacillus sp. Soil522 TaxID=1736388 RepID=UPI0006F2AD1A|nr:hypothetical protein [Paenibacillus sp. Soil522]KRE29778.1 hypothetical protein ASG81_26125 [Paenibacillus sp. Soil522]
MNPLIMKGRRQNGGQKRQQRRRPVSLNAREGTYVAAFNFDAETEMVKHASFARMGIDSSKGIVVRDLWSGQEWRIDPADDEHRIDLAPAKSKLLLFKHA